MKRLGTLLLWVYLLSISVFVSADTLKEKLESIPDIRDIEVLNSDIYKEKYVFKVRQWLNPKDSSAGIFWQRVIINHLAFDRPTVVVTEGYGAAYALRDTYQEELSKLFQTNVITVEHRYFLESTPDPLNWDYLTAENSAYDLHRIVSLLKPLYSDKWISTGISKGGQTTLLYRAFFPDDVDFSVPYVAPWNQALEDGRHEVFLHKVGKKKVRKQIENFQKTILKRRDEMIPLLENYCREKDLEFRIPMDEVLDYAVLEYLFAFWQWGTSPAAIPSPTASSEVLFAHLMAISDPSYFAENQSFVSFNVQAARELGYYGYDIKPFKDWLSIRTAEGYFNRIMVPQGLEVEFDPTLYNKVYAFLEQNDPKMIFIYGEVDPWSATRIRDLKGKKNIRIFIEPKGSHRTRISSMPDKMRTKILAQIQTWLNE